MKIKKQKVTKAIIPAGGLGTRFLPATKAQPKEMLSIVDKPIIQYIVEDLVSAGIEEIVFVTSNGKRALEDHFDRNFELEYRLLEKKKQKEYDTILKIGKLARFAFVRQDQLLGDGHAVLRALPHIPADEPVFLALGDNIIVGKKGVASQLVDVYEKYERPVLATYNVPEKETHHYGIMGGKEMKDGLWSVENWVEKPKPGKAPSTMAWPGFAILTPDVLSHLRNLRPALDGEIRNADAFKSYFNAGGSMLAHLVQGQVFDCGNKLEFVKAQIHFGLQNPETRDGLLSYLKTL